MTALTRAASLNPLPEYQWILADALRASGRAADAAAVERELVARGTASDPRTVALYLATRGENASTALSLAEAELDVRADVFTLDAHAWALAANGRTAEARAAIVPRARRRHGGRAGCSCTPASFMPPRATA